MRRLRDLLCVLALAGVSSADTLTFVDTVPLTTANWTDTLTVPRFDPALGRLQSVRIGLRTTLDGLIAIENQAPNPVVTVQDAHGVVTAELPGSGVVLVSQATAEETFDLAAEDGVLDFMGPAGALVPVVEEHLERVTLLPGTSPHFAAFVGTAHAAGTVTLSASGEGFCYPVLKFWAVTLCTMSLAAELTVTYLFEPDCSGAPGCDVDVYCNTLPNSTGQAATLGLVGSLSVDENEFALVATRVPAQVMAVLVASPDAAQVSVGDGVACVGSSTLGFVVRLPATESDGAGIVFQPVDLSDPAIPGGFVSPGSTWHFQCWFRDRAAGGAGFNFSDGVRGTFAP